MTHQTGNDLRGGGASDRRGICTDSQRTWPMAEAFDTGDCTGDKSAHVSSRSSERPASPNQHSTGGTGMKYTTSYWDGEHVEAPEVLARLVGKTIEDISGAEKDSEELKASFTDGSVLRMWHDQDCCEHVCLEDVAGDVSDLIGLPLVVAEETSSDEPSPNKYSDSHTWTFYRLATEKGWVVLRWLGESNGYYSESVDLSLETP